MTSLYKDIQSIHTKISMSKAAVAAATTSPFNRKQQEKKRSYKITTYLEFYA